MLSMNSFKWIFHMGFPKILKRYNYLEEVKEPIV